MQKSKKDSLNKFFIAMTVIAFIWAVVEIVRFGILSQSALSSNEKSFNYETKFNVNVKTGEIGTSTRISTNPSDNGSNSSASQVGTKVRTDNTQKNKNDGVASQTSPSNPTN
ncbi:hypothetical protein [Clostridium magnum]|uniref:Uncharacterized protein n=1 Tax=Clostridium magnum DSM 2767 TaxID=1121326 RepID=A0A161X0M4_9CLOT|nr:hypothetical protein [Clostridium magnum]KZL88391.1 hypothetical protein CLMAG_63180 [Clostridium magnum DSM 2767]KZL93008.1 hypothetical protein CLMAG_28220 [Clostridium magnum DSM 2767]SHJ46728.1 hypothetical protein SAMN02745944_06015 [Clostridium magnum DSM 2767]